MVEAVSIPLLPDRRDEASHLSQKFQGPSEPTNQQRLTFLYPKQSAALHRITPPIELLHVTPNHLFNTNHD